MTDNSSDNASSQGLYDQVQKVIEAVRPAIQDDGGDIELVEITAEKVACIRLHGACVGCPSSHMTLQMGVERNIRAQIPEITAVKQVS